MLLWRRACRGLGRKFALFVGVLLTAFAALVVGVNILAEQAVLEARLRERALYLSRSAAGVAATYMYDLQVSDLELIFEDIGRQDEVLYVYALDGDGIILAEGDLHTDGKLEAVRDPIAEAVRAGGRQRIVEQADAIHVGEPVQLGDQVLGTVRLGISKRRLRADIRQVRNRNLLLGLAFLLTGSLLGSLMIRRVTQPIHSLIAATRAAARGELEQRIAIDSNDELEELAESFNRMLGDLHASMAHANRLAYVDPVTDLPNRVRFREELERVVDACRRCGEQAAILFLDLDGFKRINDTLGHAAGDELLRAFARRIAQGVRSRDLVARNDGGAAGDTLLARLGGDEFILLLRRIGAAADVAGIAERLLAVVHEPFAVAGVEVFIGASIGIALIPGDGDDPETLLKHADTAMYHAKDRGRNNYQFFTGALNARAVERLTLETGLRRAVAEGQLELHFQPQIELATGRPVAAEALVRWRHPERGLLSPGLFIPVAEETGLIKELGAWCLREACRQLRRWLDATGLTFRIAVNVSAHQLRSGDLVPLVQDCLRESRLAAGLLELEITESSAMDEEVRMTGAFAALQALGVRLAVDDFGTGYSSLAYLSRFHFDLIKIDRSFVKDLETDPQAATIVRAIIAMADSLGCPTLAEGVETRPQLHLLRSCGCTFAQGYLIARPLPAAELLDWLARPMRREPRLVAV